MATLCDLWSNHFYPISDSFLIILPSRYSIAWQHTHRPAGLLGISLPLSVLTNYRLGLLLGQILFHDFLLICCVSSYSPEIDQQRELQHQGKLKEFACYKPQGFLFGCLCVCAYDCPEFVWSYRGEKENIYVNLTYHIIADVCIPASVE